MLKVIDTIKDILIKNYFRIDENNFYFYDIYADYRDSLEESSIAKIVNSTKPREEFYNLFDLSDYDFYEFQELFKILKRELKDEYYDNEEHIKDWIYENVYFNFPFSHYEKQEVLVNIIVDTGDGNYDYTCNNFMNFYAPNVEDLEIMNESSILWLVKQQGYTKKDLLNVIKHEYDKNDKFLDSLNEELLNSCSSLNALTFSVKMDLGDLLNYLENPQDIMLDPNTSCGLVNFWSGSGSLLNIRLNKKVIIPKEFARVSIDGGHGYSIREIYGMMSSYWTDTFIAA